MTRDIGDVFYRTRQLHRVGYVFSSRKGMDRIGYKQVREHLRDFCRIAGITTISPHALRHTAATYAALNGASVFELKEGFGWKSIAMPAQYVERQRGWHGREPKRLPTQSTFTGGPGEQSESSIDECDL